MWRHRIRIAMIRGGYLNLLRRARKTPNVGVRSSAFDQSRAANLPCRLVQSNGLPEVSLTMFGTEMLTMLSASSAYGYLREVVLFANWGPWLCIRIQTGKES